MATLRTRHAVLVAAVTAASLLWTPLQAGAADCTRTFTGRVPLTDLAPGQTYLGAPGGLYPGGNQRPAAHTSAGQNIATNQVRPRTPTGAVDPANGLVGLISIGMSNTSQEFSHFRGVVMDDPTLHPRLRLVDGAQGGQVTERWIDPAAPTWQVLASRLAAAGVAPAQVQVLWLKNQYNFDDLGAFPSGAQILRDQLGQIVRIARQKYPNLRLAYLSSRTYGDYSTAVRGTGAYESAFGVKWLVERQLAGDPSLAYSGAGAVAPWLSWGPYLWADGLGADRAPGGVPGRGDGAEWRCTDYNADGVHPATTGKQKVTAALRTFFRNDVTTRSWFTTP